MVTAFVGAASVMALAVLGNGMLQAEVSGRQGTVAQADAMAESGVNRAVYYVQNVNDSTKCPAAIAAGTTYTESNTTLGSAVNGKFSLQVKGLGNYKWSIQSTGVATGTDGSSVTRVINTTVEANYFANAITFGSNATIPANTTVTGDVYAPGTVSNAGNVSGTVYGSTVGNTGILGLIGSITGLNITSVPALLSTNHYGLTYTFNSRTGLFALLPGNSLTNVTLGTSPANPAGVYVATGDVTFNGNVKINGTLVINAGKLKIKGTGNSITAQAGYPAMPALVVDSDLQYIADNATLDVSGLTWLGTKVSRSGTTGAGCVLTVTGALLCTSGTGLDAGVSSIVVKYDRTKASVPGLWLGLTRPPPPTTISVVNWSN